MDRGKQQAHPTEAPVASHMGHFIMAHVSPGSANPAHEARGEPSSLQPCSAGGPAGRLPGEGQRHAPRLGTDCVSQSPCPHSRLPTSGSTLNTRLELFVTGFARLPPTAHRACISPEHLTQLSGALPGRSTQLGLGGAGEDRG